MNNLSLLVGVGYSQLYEVKQINITLNLKIDISFVDVTACVFFVFALTYVGLGLVL